MFYVDNSNIKDDILSENIKSAQENQINYKLPSGVIIENVGGKLFQIYKGKLYQVKKMGTNFKITGRICDAEYIISTMDTEYLIVKGLNLLFINVNTLKYFEIFPRKGTVIGLMRQYRNLFDDGNKLYKIYCIISYNGLYAVDIETGEQHKIAHFNKSPNAFVVNNRLFATEDYKIIYEYKIWNKSVSPDFLNKNNRLRLLYFLRGLKKNNIPLFVRMYICSFI